MGDANAAAQHGPLVTGRLLDCRRPFRARVLAPEPERLIEIVDAAANGDQDGPVASGLAAAQLRNLQSGCSDVGRSVVPSAAVMRVHRDALSVGGTYTSDRRSGLPDATGERRVKCQMQVAQLRRRQPGRAPARLRSPVRGGVYYLDQGAAPVRAGGLWHGRSPTI